MVCLKDTEEEIREGRSNSYKRYYFFVLFIKGIVCLHLTNKIEKKNVPGEVKKPQGYMMELPSL